MYPLAVVLFGAIDTEAVSIDDVRAWADVQILEPNAPPQQWLFELTLSTTLRVACEAVLKVLSQRVGPLPDNVSQLQVGLTYLRYQRGEIPRARMITEVGGILDASRSSLMDVESWYAEVTSAATIPTAVQKMLDDLAARAEAGLSQLRSTRTAASEEFWRDTTSAE